jgi:hypothetical protein
MMKYIKQLSAGIALLLFLIPSSAEAQSRLKKGTIGELEDAFSTAFALNRLSGLDAKHPNRGKVRVVVEYSAIDPEIKVFRTFGALGRWLKSRETEDGFPRTVTMPLEGCRRGSCTYDFNGGILHNHLYLKKLSYGYRNGRPYLKTIFLVNG